MLCPPPSSSSLRYRHHLPVFTCRHHHHPNAATHHHGQMSLSSTGHRSDPSPSPPCWLGTSMLLLPPCYESPPLSSTKLPKTLPSYPSPCPSSHSFILFSIITNAGHPPTIIIASDVEVIASHVTTPPYLELPRCCRLLPIVVTSFSVFLSLFLSNSVHHEMLAISLLSRALLVALISTLCQPESSPPTFQSYYTCHHPESHHRFL